MNRENGSIICPRCKKVIKAITYRHSSGGTVSIRASLRHYLHVHFYSKHPELSPRQRSLLLDKAESKRGC